MPRQQSFQVYIDQQRPPPVQVNQVRPQVNQVQPIVRRPLRDITNVIR